MKHVINKVGKMDYKSKCGLVLGMLITVVPVMSDSEGVKTLYLQNYPIGALPTQELVAQPQGVFSKMKDAMVNPFSGINSSGKATQGEVYHHMVENINSLVVQNQTSVLSLVACKNLAAIYNDSNNSVSILAQYFKTETISGEYLAASFLANPTTDVTLLRQRQEVIRLLSENGELRKNIEDLLKDFSDYEEGLVNFLKTSNDAAMQTRLSANLDKFKWIPPLAPILNNSGLYNHCSYFYSYCRLGLQMVSAEPVMTLLNGSLMAAMTGEIDGIKPFMKFLMNYPYFYKNVITGDDIAVSRVLWAAREAIHNPEWLMNAMKERPMITLLIGGCQAFEIGVAIGDFNKKQTALDFVHVQMNEVAALVKAMKAIFEAVKSCPEMSSNLQHIQGLSKYWDDGGEISSDMRELLELLETNTFTTESQFALRGRVKTAYKLMQKVNKELLSGIVAIGEIDALMTAAVCYETYKNTETPFSFVNFVTGSETPYIKIYDMWNPLVLVTTPVKNSIELGISGSPRNIILTGPNAGGKTTFLKGILTAILWAQSFGIAPVSYLEFTPFAKMNTYMSVVDSIAGGESLFMAEVRRIEELLKSTREIHEQCGFTLSIIDELFSGTSPKQGMAGSYMVGKQLGGIPTSIVLISTHFTESMSKLEEDTAFFKNYKVDCLINEDGSIRYFFTIVPGINALNVVENIFHNLDIFDDEGLKEFKERATSKNE